MTQPRMMPAPCACCPFTTNCSPEYMKSKNSTPEQFIGQAYGPFLLPCHMPPSFDKGEFQEGPQCAGAAIFRANVGVDRLLPEEVGRLPPSDKAFPTAVAFLAYQKEITLEEAHRQLPAKRIGELVRKELSNQSVRFYPKIKRAID